MHKGCTEISLKLLYKLHVCKGLLTNIFALGFLPRDTAKHHRENIIDILKR